MVFSEPQADSLKVEAVWSLMQNGQVWARDEPFSNNAAYRTAGRPFNRPSL